MSPPLVGDTMLLLTSPGAFSRCCPFLASASPPAAFSSASLYLAPYVTNPSHPAESPCPLPPLAPANPSHGEPSLAPRQHVSAGVGLGCWIGPWWGDALGVVWKEGRRFGWRGLVSLCLRQNPALQGHQHQRARRDPEEDYTCA